MLRVSSGRGRITSRIVTIPPELSRGKRRELRGDVRATKFGKRSEFGSTLPFPDPDRYARNRIRRKADTRELPTLLKRELLVWLIAAGVIAGYVALGRWIAPAQPPEPEPRANLVNVKSTKQLIDRLKADQDERERYRQAVLARQEFLLRWYQWGAAAGLILVFAYTWWRPPWYVSDKVDKSRSQTTRGRTRLPISQKALILFAATVALVIVLIVLLTRGFD